MSHILEERYALLQEDFQELGSWSARYQHVVDLGKQLPAATPENKIDANLVQGCLSKVWLWGWQQDGLIYFGGDSDAVMPKGLLGLLVRFFSGVSPAEVLSWKKDLVTELGLAQNLTPTRAAALKNMIQRIVVLAEGAQR